MNPLAATLPDVQAEPDARGVPIEEVGIEGLSYPLTVVEQSGGAQRTVGEAELVASLPASERGTHMSRFVEALDAASDSISLASTLALARGLRARLDAQQAKAQLQFPFFVDRAAPATGAVAAMRFDVTYSAWSSEQRESTELVLQAPVTSLCPCSKDISDYGAHSQRGVATIAVRCRPEADLWVEDLIAVADGAASSPIYPLLKREDERQVTMAAYDKPAFVEDLVRDIAVALRDDERVLAMRAEVANDESIHDHRAVARVRWQR